MATGTREAVARRWSEKVASLKNIISKREQCA